ncbi:hypothetical protein ACFL21_01970 [Patescibacteria group bacterium]
MLDTVEESSYEPIKRREKTLVIDFFGELIEINAQELLRIWNNYIVDKGIQSMGDTDIANPELKFWEELHNPDYHKSEDRKELSALDQKDLETFSSYLNEVRKILTLRELLVSGKIDLEKFLSRISLPATMFYGWEEIEDDVDQYPHVQNFVENPKKGSFGPFLVELIKMLYEKNFEIFQSNWEVQKVRLEQIRNISVLGFRPFKNSYQEDFDFYNKGLERGDDFNTKIQNLFSTLYTEDQPFCDLNYFGLVITLNGIQEFFNYIWQLNGTR